MAVREQVSGGVARPLTAGTLVVVDVVGGECVSVFLTPTSISSWRTLASILYLASDREVVPVHTGKVYAQL